MEYWTEPPYFETGQVMSAELQFNALCDAIDMVKSLYFFPYSTQNFPRLTRDSCFAWSNDDTWVVVRGKMRHKYNTFAYAFTVNCGSYATQQFARFKFNGVTLHKVNISGTGGAGVVYTGTFSTASLTLNTIYDVEVERTELITSFDIHYIEEQNTTILPALPAFSTLPTEAELNAMSDRITALYNRAVGAGTTPVMIGYRHDGNRETTQERGGMRARIRHKQDSLYYSFNMRFPWIGYPSERPDEDNDGEPEPGEGGQSDGSCWLEFKVNGILVKRIGFAAHINAASGNSMTFCVGIFENGDTIELETGEWVLLGGKADAYTFNSCTREYQGHKGSRALIVGSGGDHAHHLRGQNNQDEPRGNYVPFSGHLDLSSPSYGLTVGSYYELRIEEHEQTHNSGVRVANWHAMINVVYEADTSLAALAGYTTMQRRNKDQAPSFWLAVMVNNLNILRSLFMATSPVSSAIRNISLHDREIGAPYFIHRQNYLHYYVYREPGWDEDEADDGLKPEIQWFNGTEWESFSLPLEEDEYNTWMTFNLLEVETLYFGQHYRLHDVTYAFEDAEV